MDDTRVLSCLVVSFLTSSEQRRCHVILWSTPPVCRIRDIYVTWCPRREYWRHVMPLPWILTSRDVAEVSMPVTRCCSVAMSMSMLRSREYSCWADGCSCRGVPGIFVSRGDIKGSSLTKLIILLLFNWCYTSQRTGFNERDVVTVAYSSILSCRADWIIRLKCFLGKKCFCESS